MCPKLSTFGWSETEDGREWDDFVDQNRGSIFHSWSWRGVLEGANLKPFYLMCRDSDGTILAVCPFFYRPGRVLQYLDSLPDSNTAGPIIGGQVANLPGILTSLRKSVRFSPFSPVIAMRVRTHHSQVIEAMVKLGFHYTRTQLFILDLLKTDPVHVWNNGFLKHDRQAVKYFERKNTIFDFARNDDDYAGCLSLRRGSHTGSERDQLLNGMRAHMGDRLRFALAIVDGKIAAGVSMLCNPPSSTVSLKMMLYDLPARNIHSPVTYLNWKAINWARENGFRYVDFGSFSLAMNSDPYSHGSRLKARFEVTPVPRYEFVLPTSDVYYSIARRLS